jgi:hypothetical protein
MRSNVGKATRSRTQHKSTSSTKSKRSPVISKTSNSESTAAQFDGVVDRAESTALEGATGDRILEETETDSAASKSAVSQPKSNDSDVQEAFNRLVQGNGAAILSHIQARLLNLSKNDVSKNVESGAGDQVLAETEADSGMSGAVVVPEPELINVLKDAFGKEKSDRPSDDDCGEVQHLAEEDGQLNLLQFDSNEPPEPDDYPGDLEAFKKAYLAWIELQEGTAEEEYQHITAEEIWNQSDNGNGSICAQELGLDSPTPGLDVGDDRPITSANGMDTAKTFSNCDILEPEQTEISSCLISKTTGESTIDPISLLPVPPANLLAQTESNSELRMIETASPTCLKHSENSILSSQLSKMSKDCLAAPLNQVRAIDISLGCSEALPTSGTMQNGNVSAAPTLEVPGEGKDCLLLRSPGALSGGDSSRPPGKNKLETQLIQSGLITNSEVANPEFLEAGYNLPVGWTNPQENRTALELAQVQAQQLPSAPSSELLQEMEATAIVEAPSATPCIGQLPPSDSKELNISLTLPPNIGALGKAELISLAQEQHQIISLIERKQFELAVEKIHRIRLTGEYLIEFKKRCQYGEFLQTLESHGIGSRSAQEYMLVAKNWETVEAKARVVALLPEENRPTLGIKWALEALREDKKQLKKEAPPKDPDGWKSPDTKDQPVVSLVKKSLGGQIWLDPCSDEGGNIPAAVRYYKTDDGLARHNTWSKTVFINPPFSDPFPWVERCCFEFARGNVSAAIMLLKAGVVSNVGTGELINKYASAICHWRGRINFLNDEGNPIKGSDFDCVLIYFGARLDLFRQNFGGRGTIATIENHYSSVNKKFLLKSEIPEFGNTQAEQKQLAAAVGLGNGKSVLPDMRDADRERMERYDPHTVVDVLSVPTMSPTVLATPISENFAQPIGEAETFAETPLAVRQFEKAKQNTLNDYITAISGNLSDFSDNQIAFLAKIINEESAKRIGF